MDKLWPYIGICLNHALHWRRVGMLFPSALSFSAGIQADKTLAWELISVMQAGQLVGTGQPADRSHADNLRCQFGSELVTARPGDRSVTSA